MIANSLQAVVTQNLMPTADGHGRIAALEILLPDDAVRNLIRQAKTEQVYSVMQTNTARGMMTMEQSLADLALRRVVDIEVAISRSSRPDQLIGILERSGMPVEMLRQNGAGNGARRSLRSSRPDSGRRGSHERLDLEEGDLVLAQEAPAGRCA